MNQERRNQKKERGREKGGEVGGEEEGEETWNGGESEPLLFRKAAVQKSAG